MYNLVTYGREIKTKALNGVHMAISTMRKDYNTDLASYQQVCSHLKAEGTQFLMGY